MKTAFSFLSVCICVNLWFLSGCASDAEPTTRPSSTYERQQAALEDPFGYSPNMDNDKPDVSGGDLGHFDCKGMKRDIDHVLNP